MRRQDVLTPLKGEPKRKKFLTLDIESKKDEGQEKGFERPFLVGIYDGESYVEFRDEPHLRKAPWRERHLRPGGCIDKAMNYLLRKKYVGYHFYAHNGGGFDWLFCPAWLHAHMKEFSTVITPVQSSIQKITVERVEDERRRRKKKKDTWSFLDSMKLFPGKLEKMLQTFKCGSKVAHDLDLDEEDPHWGEYLKQDCVGLYRALVKLHDLMETKLEGEVGMTAPSTAMKLFRRRFLGRGETPARIVRHQHFPSCPDARKRRHHPGDCEGCCHAFIRRGYYGGRTEVVRAYGKGLRYYDMNSSYVAAMRQPMPGGNMFVEEAPTHIDELKAKRYVGFVECEVEVPETCYLPPLPHRRREDGKLVFPKGRFTGVWDLEELRLLDHPLVRGHIVKLRRIVWFKKVYLFRDMVDVLWAYRDREKEDFDEGLSELAKLMGNSTYGKFGMNQERTQVVRRLDVEEGKCFLCGEDVASEGLCVECQGSKPCSGDPESEYWYQRRYTDAPYIIPQISAHITSLGRISLWNFAAQALERGGSLYYMDTDSCITDVELPSSKRLGEFKDECPGRLLEGSFVQPKVYRIWEMDQSHEARMQEWHAKVRSWIAQGLDVSTLDGTEPKKLDKVTMKGFPGDVRTPENLAKLREGETLAFSRLEKIRTLARAGFVSSPKMVPVTKSFKTRRSDKRVLLANGDTSALTIIETPYDEDALAAAE